MQSLIFSIAARYLTPILLVLSLIVLYRGHNLPGGGFIGGLVAAAAFLLPALADGWDDALRRMRFEPLNLIAIGLSTALLSGVPALFASEPLLTGMWLPGTYLPVIGKFKLGTPLLFDVGVYLTVLGITLKCAHALGTEAPPENAAPAQNNPRTTD